MKLSGDFIKNFHKEVFILKKVNATSNLHQRKVLNIAKWNFNELLKKEFRNILILIDTYDEERHSYKLFNLHRDYFEEGLIEKKGSNSDYLRFELKNEGIKIKLNTFIELSKDYIRGQKRFEDFKQWVHDWDNNLIKH